MKSVRNRTLLFAVPLLVLSLIAGSFTLALSSAGQPTPENVLQNCPQTSRPAGQLPPVCRSSSRQ